MQNNFKKEESHCLTFLQISLMSDLRRWLGSHTCFCIHSDIRGLDWNIRRQFWPSVDTKIKRGRPHEPFERIVVTLQWSLDHTLRTTCWMETSMCLETQRPNWNSQLCHLTAEQVKLLSLSVCFFIYKMKIMTSPFRDFVRRKQDNACKRFGMWKPLKKLCCFRSFILVDLSL